ncbi:unnamed protein product [Albugo candida]|nr:unnamed protein product [Albugo candida]|eukprot:CCI43980.1 unnamed protein product [Albugo candida]
MRLRKRLSELEAKVFTLEQLNALRSAQNDTLTREIDQLLEWKQKALDHLTSVAPMRNRAKKQLEQARSMKKRLEALEQCLLKRLTLEIDAQSARKRGQKMETQLAKRNQQCELDAKYWEACYQVAAFENETLENCFGSHLEQLIEIEEMLSNVRCDRIEAPIHTETSSVSMESLSTKCLAWLRRFSQEELQVEMQEKIDRLAGFQEKIGLFEKKYHVYELESAKATKQMKDLQCKNDTLEKETALLRHTTRQISCAHAEMGNSLQTIINQVNRYLQVVNAEVKKKFGFFPDALTHAHQWTVLTKQMEALREFQIASCL